MEQPQPVTPETPGPTNGRPPLTLTAATRAGDIVFRIPHEMDLWSLYGALPLLKMAALEGQTAPSAADLVDAFAKGRKSVGLANALLIACALVPELTEKKGIPTPDLIYIECLGARERFEIMTKLLTAAGFSFKEAERIRPTSPTVEASKASSSSTPSGSDTDNGPAH